MSVDFSQITPTVVPSVQAELDREGGLQGAPVDAKKLLLLGYKTSAGAAAAGAVKRITSLNVAMEQFGEGSMVAAMAEAVLDVAPSVSLYGVAFAENVGGVQATGTIAIANAATGSGTLKLWIGGRLVQVGIAKSDTVQNISDAIIAAFAQLQNLPFTLSQGSGPGYVITVTARNDGAAGNTIRIRSEITSGIATTCTVVAMASGATEGDPTSVLTGVEGDRYHLICLGTPDATTLGVLSAHCEKQCGPDVQKWGIGIIGAVGTRNAAESLASGDDSYNSQIVWHQEAEIPVFELAARFAAYRAAKAANVPVIDASLKGIVPAYDETKWPTENDIKAAIEGGVTPLRPLRNGSCQIVRSVLTRQTAPISYRDHNPEEIWHYTLEYIIGQFASKVKGKRLKSASPPGRPETVTPDRATALLNLCLYELDRLDYLQGVKDSIAAGNNFCEVNAIEPTTRLDGAFDFIPVGIVVQMALKGTLKRPFSATL